MKRNEIVHRNLLAFRVREMPPGFLKLSFKFRLNHVAEQ